MDARELTEDHLAADGLRLLQPRRGYRFSLDALLLADFARLRPGDRVADLGTGCGVVALVLARRHPRITVTAVEIQPRLAALARENARRNGLDRRVSVVEADMAGLPAEVPAGTFDHVVANPPFRPPGAGRLCPDPEEAQARHEIRVDLGGLVAAARRLLRPGGRLTLVYAAERAVDLLTALRGARIEPKRLRWVHPGPGAPARLLLVEACRDAGVELAVLPPLVLSPPENDPG
ncbi:tRNA1(Val) (adenine(37)-N6)-methyltransferase [Dissulfurirhabdus thermomarina]|uniref:tRNA1(Val) (Adenine(37)-N6)-methyltransferase n=1 Tax=Dissulfurirhabdus thermomarina TaxID=1765737 RepID=A0A6N9TSP2_DISTH|nr:tRNA1(Val) (adenine(37)-N6)-methyltransferase [Dissulfurirhabdus thermomarina]NDY42467.1 tRNA1(Val) (adenine(37)-N6)-methyltransferase [Dissulfurirhabdus thermomarina]NMX23855.1 tRNA1(Val) (adenine(37)-N6)-methyltransferase [Dissulfurirhabdus thermomarina]